MLASAAAGGFPPNTSKRSVHVGGGQVTMTRVRTNLETSYIREKIGKDEVMVG